MPPRHRGLAGRIADAVGRATRFFRNPEPTPPTQPPEPPERPTPEPPIIDRERTLDTRLREEFFYVTGTTQEEPEWRELFETLSIDFDSDRERVHLYGEFLRAFYLTSTERGSVPRRTFYDDTGIPPSAIDWGMWREIKRGTP